MIQVIFFALFLRKVKPKSTLFASGGAFSRILRSCLRRTLGGDSSGGPSAGGGFFGLLRSPDVPTKKSASSRLHRLPISR